MSADLASWPVMLPLCKQSVETRLGDEVGDNGHDCRRRRWAFVDRWHAQTSPAPARRLDLIRQRSGDQQGISVATACPRRAVSVLLPGVMHGHWRASPGAPLPPPPRTSRAVPPYIQAGHAGSIPVTRSTTEALVRALVPARASRWSEPG